MQGTFTPTTSVSPAPVSVAHIRCGFLVLQIKKLRPFSLQMRRRWKPWSQNENLQVLEIPRILALDHAAASINT